MRGGPARVAVLLVAVVVHGGSAVAASVDDPGAWTGNYHRGEGVVRVQGRTELAAPAVRAAPARGLPDGLRTDRFRTCRDAADSHPLFAATGRRLDCVGVSCTAGGRRGESHYTVTRRFAGEERVGPMVIGADRCVPFARNVSLDDLVVRQFRDLKLPGSRVTTDPEEWTVVNWETTFTAKPEWASRELGTVLGRRVSVTITPVRYRWAFGDGLVEKGGDTVRHTYAGSGDMAVSVAATYRASYRVAGGSPRRIPGTVTVPGPVTELTVYEVRTQLVANPGE